MATLGASNAGYTAAALGEAGVEVVKFGTARWGARGKPRLWLRNVTAHSGQSQVRRLAKAGRAAQPGRVEAALEGVSKLLDCVGGILYTENW